MKRAVAPGGDTGIMKVGDLHPR